jgi:hypothetical protein
MILLSPAVRTLLSQKRIETFFLVTIDTYRFTSLPYDITMSDGLSYLSDGGLMNVEPPRLSSSIDRESYKISLADTAFNFRSILEEGIVGKQLVVRVGVINNSDAPLLDAGSTFVDVDLPLNNLQDTFLAYKGIIDSHQYAIEIEEGTVTLTLEGSSPMADLDMIKQNFTNRETARIRNPSDSSMDFVFNGSMEVTLRWGKT